MAITNLNTYPSGSQQYRMGANSNSMIYYGTGLDVPSQPASVAGDVYKYQYLSGGVWYDAKMWNGSTYVDKTYTATSNGDTGFKDVGSIYTDSAQTITYPDGTTGVNKHLYVGSTTSNDHAGYTRSGVACSHVYVDSVRIVNTTNATRSPTVVQLGDSWIFCCQWRTGYYINAVHTTSVNITFDGTNYVTDIPWPPTFDGVVFDAVGWVYLTGQTDTTQNRVWKVAVQTAGTNTILYPDTLTNIPANLGSIWPAASVGTFKPTCNPTDGTNRLKPYTLSGGVLTEGYPSAINDYDCSSDGGGGSGGGGTGSDTVKIYDEGTLVGTVTEINFIGIPVTATLSGSRADVTVNSTTGIELKQDGTSLGTVTSLNVTGTGITASATGADGALTGDAMVWKGDWTDSFDYKKNHVVRNTFTGNAYVCSFDHTSSAGDEPGVGSWWAQNWDVMTDVTLAAMPPEQKDFLTQLKDSVFDWIDNATVGDWLQALAVGAGIIYAGSVISDMMSQDGQGDGQADQRYNGTAGYNGSFTAPSLQAVVSSIMEYAGYTAAQYDVTQLPAKEVHFTISSTMALRDILANLATVYQFDIVPSGDKVKFIPKTLSVVRTFKSADLGHTSSSDLSGSAPYTAKRVQGIDLPRSVTLNYYSAALDHNVFTQVSTLETYASGQDVKLEVPFTLADDEAKRITESALVNAHIEQQQYTFVTDYHNIDLEPGDIINMPLDSGGNTNVRIIQIRETDDGLLEFTVVRADFASSSYSGSAVTVQTPPAQTTNTPVSIGYSQALFIEVPPLNDSDTSPRVKVAIHGYGAEGWPGAALYKSVDGGATYSMITSSNTTPTIGMVSSAMAAPALYQVWDTTTTITVTLKQGTLTNSSDIAVQNGTNWCMIGEEVIGFVNATLTGPNTYQLSRLLRGRAGTEVKCGSHVTNELFVLLDEALTTITIDQADIGKTVKYKAVTFGSDISLATAVDVQPFGLNMRPWRVAQPKLKKETNGDWTISWIERPRYNNGMRDYTEISHDPDWGGYAVAILDNTDAVKRTTTTVGTTFTYTVAMQQADFGSAQTTLKASIVQMTQSAGGGYPYVVTA